MSGLSLALTYISLFVVVGAVVAVITLARARTSVARAGGEQLQHYRELAERCATEQQRTADELEQLTDRLAAVEKLLRDVR
jgi:hypothetical protein